MKNHQSHEKSYHCNHFIFLSFQAIAQENKVTVIDSNTQGKLLFIQPELVCWTGTKADTFVFDRKLSSMWTQFKLYGENILFNGNGCLQSIHVHTSKIDTLMNLSAINYYDQIRVKDSLISTLGNVVTLFNYNTKSILFSIGDNLTAPNILLGDKDCYIIVSPDSVQVKPMEDMHQKIFQYNYADRKFTEIYRVKNVNNSSADNFGDWNGMYVHHNLLFVQFIREMMVFDIAQKKLLSQTNLLDDSTMILEAKEKSVVFINEVTGKKIQYLVDKNEFKE